LNGTGTLSPSSNAFTLSAKNGSTPFVLTGIVNSTFSCTILTLLSYAPETVKEGPSNTGPPPSPPPFPIEWDFSDAPPLPNFDFTVNTATFLGAGGDTSSNFVATGIAILSVTSPSVIFAVSGNGRATFSGVSPSLLFNATPASNGTLVIFSVADVHSTTHGAEVLGVVKVGERLDHVRANAGGEVAIAGSFGVSVLTGLASAPSGVAPPRPSVKWWDDLALLEPGTCGVCCSLSNGRNTTCRVDIGDDGLVVASYGVETQNGFLWGVYDSDGFRMLQEAQWGSSLTSVYVDSRNKQFGVSWIYVSNTGRESMIMPRVQVYSYGGVGGGTTAPAFSIIPWDAKPYRQAGVPCDGDVADGRVEDVRIGRDGTLLFAGRSDGGNTPFRCDLRNISRLTPLGVIDRYTTPYDMQSQAITNMLRLDPTSGQVVMGQIQLVRLGENGSGNGNTLITMGVQTDARGFFYELQASACCIPFQKTLTVNGQTLQASGDGSALLILSPDLQRRITWTEFVVNGSVGEGGWPVDIDVRGDAVVLAMNAGTKMAIVNALKNTATTLGPAAGYVLVFPTVTTA